jgi:hypothetical protein
VAAPGGAAAPRCAAWPVRAPKARGNPFPARSFARADPVRRTRSLGWRGDPPPARRRLDLSHREVVMTARSRASRPVFGRRCVVRERALASIWTHARLLFRLGRASTQHGYAFVGCCLIARTGGGGISSPFASAGRSPAGCKGAVVAGVGRGKQGHLVDALAPRGDEGRGTLRQAPGSREQALIRGSPNGATHPP